MNERRHDFLDGIGGSGDTNCGSGRLGRYFLATLCQPLKIQLFIADNSVSIHRIEGIASHLLRRRACSPTRMARLS